MSQPLTDAINALTTYANSITGASDTTLSDAVDTLVDGYGGGGGSGVITGSFTPSANESTHTFSVGSVPTGGLVVYAVGTVTGQSVKAFFMQTADYANLRSIVVWTSNSGGSLGAPTTGAITFSGSGDKYYTLNNLKTTLHTDGTVTLESTGGTVGYFISGVTYNWIAW